MGFAAVCLQKMGLGWPSKTGNHKAELVFRHIFGEKIMRAVVIHKLPDTSTKKWLARTF